MPMLDGSIQVGMGGRFVYLWPTGGKAPFVPPNSTDTRKIDALGMSDQLAIDLHPGGAFEGLNNTEEVLSTPAFEGWAGAMVLETNCGDHTIRRMLIEAQDLNRFASYDRPQMLGRAASFCSERSGYNEGQANDQGITFFLPNMTWMQPPAHVHAMNAKAAQPRALSLTTAGPLCDAGLVLDARSGGYANNSYPPSGTRGAGGASGAVSAQVSDDGSRLVVRLVNALPVPKNFTFSVVGGRRIASAQVTSISGWPLDGQAFRLNMPAGANTPAEPERFAPTPPRALDDPTWLLAGPYSYSVVECVLTS